MPKYLDSTGLGYFWSKIKSYIDSRYSAMTQAQASAGTDTAGKLISPKVLDDKIKDELGTDLMVILDGDTLKFFTRGTVGSNASISVSNNRINITTRGGS